MHKHLSLHARRLYLLGVVIPTMEYSSVAFCMQASSADRERLEAIFRRAIRTACGVPRDTPMVDLLKQLNVRGLLDYWLLKVGTLA